MAIDPGIFTLKSAQDLFKKLEHDCEALRQEPANAYICFNFFVTAEHLPEWHLDADAKKADALRRTEPILRLCSHLANGAKHFVTKDPKHDSVQSTNQESVLRLDAADQSSRSSDKSPREEFFVTYQADGDVQRTQEVSVTDLADRIVIFWRKKLLGDSG